MLNGKTHTSRYELGTAKKPPMLILEQAISQKLRAENISAYFWDWLAFIGGLINRDHPSPENARSTIVTNKYELARGTEIAA